MDVDALELVCIVLGGAVIIGYLWRWMMNRIDREESTRLSRQLLQRTIKERREAEWFEKLRRLPSSEYDPRS